MVGALSRLSGVLVAVLCIAMVAGATNAATVSYSTVLPGVATVNLEASGTTGTAVLDENVTGSILNQRSSPWAAANSGIDPNTSTAFYSAIRSTTGVPATAFFNFTTVMRELSFVWGTPGPLNRVELFLNGVSQLLLVGSTPQGATGTLSVLTMISDVRFDKLVFTAGKPALEYANLTVAAVPLPAGGLMLLGALAGISTLRRRCKAA